MEERGNVCVREREERRGEREREREGNWLNLAPQKQIILNYNHKIT